jgi:quercetin dioxygenase-like cupin family protein
MHVAPVDLRALRQGGIVLRFAMLGEMAYVFAELPATGSSGTTLEEPCRLAHWGFVIDGELTFIRGDHRQAIPAGRAFHVPPGGPEHRFEASGRVLVAGFQPLGSELDVSEEGLRERGFEALSPSGPGAPTVVPVMPARKVPAGRILTETWPMSSFLLTRSRMGERSGYVSGWCDAPHWGLVTDGKLAIEWEDDVEILSTGDVFHCPAGPPGHRLEAADPATFVDLTPISALSDGGRLADWRRGVDVTSRRSSRGIAVAALG